MTFYKYTSGQKALKRLLVNRTIRFTPPEELNDPFELSGILGPREDPGWDAIVNQVPEDNQAGRAFLESVRADFERNAMLMNTSRFLGILCLSRVCNNLLMWSHYGDSHRGFVIGYDSEHEFFARNSWNRKPEQVVYTDVRSDFRDLFDAHVEAGTSVELPVDANRRLVIEKSLHWSYEQEVQLYIYIYC